MRPFLKWAGGKHRLVDKITAILPHGNRLVEPFVGSGAVFLGSTYRRYLLADANPDLIEIYKALQKDPAGFLLLCSRYFAPRFNCKNAFLDFRSRFNALPIGSTERAALFIYLNRHGFNGLCRYNGSGGFNVPFGRYTEPYFPFREMMNFAVRAEQAKFICSDFREVMQGAKAGDVIYADPPYFPLEQSAGFTDYTTGGFSLSDQADLADLAKLCARRGIAVVISNHATNLARRMYKGARIRSFDVQRYISCDGANRNTARELLAIFEPITNTNDKANHTRLNALSDEGECLVENAAA